MIRIMLIDRFPLICAGLRSSIEHEPNIEIVCEVQDVNEICDEINKCKPDVVILGIVDYKINNLAVLQMINCVQFPPKVIMLSSSLHSEDVMESLRYGARGYMGKEVTIEEIPAMVTSICNGNIVVSKHVSTTTQKSGDTHISKREMEVLRLVGCGYSNKEISQKLYISLTTTNTYVHRLIDKLQFHNRNDLLIYTTSLIRSLDEPLSQNTDNDRSNGKQDS